MKLTKKEKNELMGRIVVISKIYEKQYLNGIKTYIEKPIEPALAWITGFGVISEGKLYDDNGFNTFKSTNVISTIKVKLSYKSKEINIPLESFILSDEGYPEAPSDKQNKEYSSNMLRDDKGRFIKSNINAE